MSVITVKRTWEPRGLDALDLDPDTWPEALIEHLPLMDQWRALSRLYQVGLAHASPSTEALLRLWERGRRSDEFMAEQPLRFVHAPRWVNAVVAAAFYAGRPLLDVFTEEMFCAAEAVARMAPAGVDSYVAVYNMLAGELSRSLASSVVAPAGEKPGGAP